MNDSIHDDNQPDPLMTAIVHELSHAAEGRSHGHQIVKVEWLHSTTGNWFGEVHFSASPTTPREEPIVIAFAGPLAEVRFGGHGKVIDKEKSFDSLANALNGGALVFFEGEEEPRYFPPQIFGTDWNRVFGVLAEAKDEGHEFDKEEVFRSLLDEAIEKCNEPVRWDILHSVSETLVTMNEVTNVEMGSSVDLSVQFNTLLNPHFPN